MADAPTGVEGQVAKSDWGGGKSPVKATWNKLMMWLFLISDALSFGALLAGYGMLRMASPSGSWPNQSEVFNINLVAAMTFILICSSVTMVKALSAIRRGDTKRLRNYLALTILGGVVFLGLQVYEWNSLINHGLALDGNHWGAAAFGPTFYTTTGFHGLHVTGGIILLTIVLIKGLRGRYSANDNGGVELVGLYWHFVDLIWILVFTFLYLI